MRMKMVHMKKTAVITAVFVLSISLIACSANSGSVPANGNPTDSGSQKAGAVKSSKVEHPPWYQKPSEERLKLAQEDVISTETMASGPRGKAAFPASKIVITDEQLQKIKAGNYKAAIAMGFSGDDWSEQQVAGLKTEFKRLGIEVIAQTSADFKDSKQIADIEAALMKKPDILVSIPLNAQTQAAVYKKAAESGTKVVFIDQPVDGMDPGKDYVSVVSSDNFGLGMQIADELAKAIGNQGDVAALYFAPDFYVTNVRYEGFIARLEAKHPNINLVAVAGFQDWNTTQDVTAGLLTKYPNLKGIYASWDVPAMGAISAAKISGKSPSDFAIVTEGVGHEVALNMAQNGFVKGIGAYLPYDQGVAEAALGALSLIGAEVPPFVAVPAPPVNRSNLAESFQRIYHRELPQDIANELK
ncbi:substrate-binding domain-containing protein [Paenibacillus validus]|uniref:substrate-binding domain-containing protein n=1 Tax=Paenibacillus validus TaxID=44253 RepID=UPI0013DFB94A|nr:substrate-binding domain-containing protein [Paenibacillus validus]MED4599808.1 substrate-binding domain-containing protein [Paenibacillus validus]MED4604662.1 substrate-binding domain-containing protein [Paenibacillus validus]